MYHQTLTFAFCGLLECAVLSFFFGMLKPTLHGFSPDWSQSHTYERTSSPYSLLSRNSGAEQVIRFETSFGETSMRATSGFSDFVFGTTGCAGCVPNLPHRKDLLYPHPQGWIQFLSIHTPLPTGVHQKCPPLAKEDWSKFAELSSEQHAC